MNYQQNLENHNNLISNMTNVVTDIDNSVQNLPAYENTYATAIPNDILEGKTAVVNESMITGIRPDLNNILNQQDNIINSIQNSANIFTNITNSIPQVRELNPNIRFADSRDTTLNFYNFVISPNANNMAYMFYGIDNTTVNITTLNTTNITNMFSMFGNIYEGCNIYTNNLNTRNVEDMAYMFNRFSNQSNFYGTTTLDTSNVTNMCSMFRLDTQSFMQNIDLPNFNVGKVRDMSYMFASAFVHGNLSNWRVNNVLNMYGMFLASNFSNVSGFNNWNICNVTRTDYMFQNVTTNYNLLKQVQKWNFGSVTAANYMFSNINIALENNTIDLRSSLKNLFKIPNTHAMFASINNVNNVNMSGLRVNNCYATDWFSRCSNLTAVDVSNMIVESNANLSNMFNNCYNLNSVNFANINITSTLTKNMVDVNTVKYIDISNYHGITDIPNFLAMGLYGGPFSNLKELNVADSFMVFDNGSLTQKPFTNRRNLIVINTTNTTTNTTNFGGAFENCRNLVTITDYNFLCNLTNCNFMRIFNYCCNLQDNISISNIVTNPMNSSSFMFNCCYNITDVNLDNWKMNLYYNTSMYGMLRDWFSNCYNLTNLSLTNMDIWSYENGTSSNINNLAQNCRNLKNVNFANITLSNIYAIYNSFNCCTNLKNIDLSGVDYSETKYAISNSFNNCTNLISVNIKSSTYNKLGYIYNIFSNCTNLKDITWGGQTGIVFNNLKVAYNIFRNCYNLNFIDFNSVTLQGQSNVYLNNLFYRCNNLSQDLLTSFFNLLIRCNTCIRTKNLYNTNYYSPFYGTNIGKVRINATGLNADLVTAGYTF